MRLYTLFVCVIFIALMHPTAGAQNPVQWSGSVSQSVARARESLLPLLFWVSGGRDFEGDDLEEAQLESFRDRTVVAIIHKDFVPVRVSRSSRVMEEAAKLGLPTTHGLYAAVMTPDGKLIAQIGPGEIAEPAAFAKRLAAAFTQYRDDLYNNDLKPKLENFETPKAEARLAAQTVWRLGILSADTVLVRLLDRPDLTAGERGRLYGALTTLATKPCIEAVLARAGAGDEDAVRALCRAEPGALEFLVPELPGEQGEQGEPTKRQMAAYRACMMLCHFTPAMAEGWWAKAEAAARKKELDRLRAKSERVLEYWKENQADAR